jgi:hypothetical protein
MGDVWLNEHGRNDLVPFSHLILHNMKFRIIFLVSAYVLAFVQGQAQESNTVEDTLIVKGVCGMCQKRIEEAAYGKGVKFVSWDKVTDQLAVAYRTDKTSIEEIEQRILAAGHSTADHEAPAEAYDNLPACCRYDELEDH